MPCEQAADEKLTVRISGVAFEALQRLGERSGNLPDCAQHRCQTASMLLEEAILAIDAVLEERGRRFIPVVCRLDVAPGTPHRMELLAQMQEIDGMLDKIE